MTEMLKGKLKPVWMTWNRTYNWVIKTYILDVDFFLNETVDNLLLNLSDSLEEDDSLDEDVLLTMPFLPTPSKSVMFMQETEWYFESPFRFDASDVKDSLLLPVVVMGGSDFDFLKSSSDDDCFLLLEFKDDLR